MTETTIEIVAQLKAIQIQLMVISVCCGLIVGILWGSASGRVNREINATMKNRLLTTAICLGIYGGGILLIHHWHPQYAIGAAVFMAAAVAFYSLAKIHEKK
jgi:hypothetical protein